MLNRLVLALSLALGASGALAQAPAAPAAPATSASPATPASPAAPAGNLVPQARCEPQPVYPGAKAIQDPEKREALTRVIKDYQDCVRDYVDERKAYVEASNAAIRKAVEEHNAVMNKFREDQEKAKKELGQ